MVYDLQVTANNLLCQGLRRGTKFINLQGILLYALYSKLLHRYVECF